MCPYLITSEAINTWPAFTVERPLRILFSGCLAGAPCGVDGTSYGEYPWLQKIIKLPNVKVSQFCPEDFSFGTPRSIPDIHGGNGFDVLDGKARVMTEKSEDWTRGMINGANKMLEIAQSEKIDLAILQDVSGACGTQVIYSGSRLDHNKTYQQGPGVCAALLISNGIKVVSQRDFKTLETIMKKLNPAHQIDPEAIDHHETKWYKDYFSTVKGPL